MMKAIWKLAVASAWLLLALPSVHAAISCSVSAPAVTMFYQEQSTAKVQATLTVNCTRTSNGDPSSVNYAITADNGDYAQGSTNRARRVVFWIFQSNVAYELYTNSSCTTAWNAPTAITGTATWTGTGTSSQTHSFWACIPQQAVALDGTHTDSVSLTMTYNYNGTRTTGGTLGMNIITPASCAITTPPGNITLAYPAFSPTNVTADSTVGMRCTANMPYTVEILPAADVLSGVRYSVTALPPAGTGTGNPVNHTIRATAPAGQAGQCGTGTCSATRTHELRITY